MTCDREIYLCAYGLHRYLFIFRYFPPSLPPPCRARIPTEGSLPERCFRSENDKRVVDGTEVGGLRVLEIVEDINVEGVRRDKCLPLVGDLIKRFFCSVGHTRVVRPSRFDVALDVLERGANRRLHGVHRVDETEPARTEGSFHESTEHLMERRGEEDPNAEQMQTNSSFILIDLFILTNLAIHPLTSQVHSATPLTS